MKKHISIGLLAHVDAGKTTLSEGLLFESGTLRKAGRVDNGDTFLDTDDMEKERGITIFSKQAVMDFPDVRITLLDTPGHVDFSAEMERTLQVLDYAILVISGADVVQGHTVTLWRLLKEYQIPTFLFINKMDQPGLSRPAILRELQEKLSDGCVDFSDRGSQDFYENVAANEEEALEYYLENGMLEDDTVRKLIEQRMIFPCYFGSALRMQGVRELLEGVLSDTNEPVYGSEFGARVYKITRDEQGNRLTHMKITGGSLAVRTALTGEDREENPWEEKVNQIRVYSGDRYEAKTDIAAGMHCAVTGLNYTFPGEGLGTETETALPILEPVLSYRMILPEEVNPAVMLPKLRELEEEEPELHIVWDEELQEMKAQIMGDVQIEILKRRIFERFGVEIGFGNGSIVYKETIAAPVEGVGHFEPLKHYAEVHLLLEPGEPGSGMEFAVACGDEVLAKNWQRLIMTHLMEKEHRGVLVGAPVTDMRITLLSGRAHLKHTEGGDFRQATYRAVRQGLRKAHSVLLEPYYEFRMEIPEKCIGRAMTDIEKMHGSIAPPERQSELAVLTGSAPVSLMQDYHRELISYTGGQGRLFCSVKGYERCHNEDEIIEKVAYEPEADLENPTGSVFCAHGAGFAVNWNEVEDYMHLEPAWTPVEGENAVEEGGEVGKDAYAAKADREHVSEEWLGTEEIDAILERTYRANKKSTFIPHKGIARSRASMKNRRTTIPAVTKTAGKKTVLKEEYLLVDGYNIIFAWEDLNELAKTNIDGARGKLLDILCNYQGMKKCNLIVVFDAYRVAGHATEILDYHNIHVVYTKEAETADQYIEKFAHENGKKYRVTVATSDGLEQIIIRGAGCLLMSAGDLKKEIELTWKQLRENWIQ